MDYRTRRLPTVAFALLALVSTQALASNLQCGDLPPIFGAFTAHHYLYNSIDHDIQARTAERFVALLDPTRTMLLQADADKLKAELPGVFETMRNGSCALVDHAWNLLASRAAEDEQVAQKMLTPTYALDESVQLVLDPEKRERPKTTEERRARVKDMVHFQISNFLQSGLNLEQAKKQLLHRYALTVKRLNERKDKGELPGLYAEAFAEALDPHTSFVTADELADFKIQMHLSLEGIGAVLRSEDGFTIVESLVPGSQAEKCGQLRPKDKIIAVSQEKDQPVSTMDMDLRDVVKMIRGKKGTEVALTVLREGKTSQTFRVTLTRDKIDVASSAAKITYAKRERNGRHVKIGVIDLPSFYGGEDGGRSSTKDMKKLLREANEQKVDGIVLDLTRNGGGLLEEAVSVAGLFINKGGIVATKDGRGKVEVIDDKDEGALFNGPLLVLVSRSSASASEILAGALKDYRRAIVAGSDHTFGKASVQVIVPLASDIGAIKVTTAMFFLPAGESTQRQGVAADIHIPTVFDDLDIGESSLKYALAPQSISPFMGSNAHGGGATWRPVDAALVSTLAQRSKERVAADPEFDKLAKVLADIEKNRGVVRLADFRKRGTKGGAENGDEDEQYKALGQITVKESVDVVADAVAAPKS
jgi:carboxyl-terminal processing protease